MKRAHLLCLLVLLYFSCSKDEGTPESLIAILERNGYDENAGGGNGNGNGEGIDYQGAYSADVKNLLAKVSGWRTPSSLNTNDGIPPNVPIGNNCIRDTYVAAAVNYAWAAESYYRLGEVGQAAQMAALMNTQLTNARNLCSTAPGAGGGNCLTFSIYPC